MTANVLSRIFTIEIGDTPTLTHSRLRICARLKSFATSNS
jgi:hypothetical protein